MEKKLKHKLLDAIISGELGTRTDRGTIVTTKQFVLYFENERKKEYLSSYLPSVTIEAGRHEMQHNKYLFRIGHGVFRIHEDAITKHHLKHNSSMESLINKSNGIIDNP